MNVSKIVSLSLCSALLSCTATTPNRVQYLLRTQPASGTVRVESPVQVGLGNVAIAPYLRQPGLVLATEVGKVRAAASPLWAEPLDSGLRSYLRAEVSRQLGYEISAARVDRLQWDYTIDVYVDRLHGTMAGTALLDASYRLTPREGGATAVEYRFSKTVGLPREGYSGLVEAETALLGELATAIAVSLAELRGR